MTFKNIKWRFLEINNSCFIQLLLQCIVAVVPFVMIIKSLTMANMQ